MSGAGSGAGAVVAGATAAGPPDGSDGAGISTLGRACGIGPVGTLAAALGAIECAAASGVESALRGGTEIASFAGIPVVPALSVTA